MKNNRDKSGTFLTGVRWAALLGVGGVAGFWLGLAGRASPLLVAAAFVAATVAGVVWLVRSRAQQQTQAVWDAYAEREIDRARPAVARRRMWELANEIHSRRDFDARTHSQTR